MSDVVGIKLAIQADTRAAQAVRKEIEQLVAASQKTAGGAASAAAAKQAAAYANIQKSAAGAAVAQQKLATEQQKTATAANQAATANARLSTEQHRTATAAAQAAAAQDRAALSALRLAQAQAKAAAGASSTSTYFSQMGDAVANSISNIVGPAAVVTTAIAGIKAAGDLAVVGANAALVRDRFDDLAVSAGTTGAALLNALRAASGGEISDLNLQLAANKAQLLGVADSADEFGVLMQVARDRAQQMGISTTQAFNDLVTGLGRGSALILDNLGITVSVTEANEAYAASLGKSASALTEAESKQALINAVLAQGKASLEATGGAADSNAASFAEAGASIENAKNKLGELLSYGFAPIAEQATQTANATAGLVDGILSIGTATASAAQLQAAAAAGAEAYNAALERGGTAAQAAAAYQKAHAEAMQEAAAMAAIYASAADAAYSANVQAALAAGQSAAIHQQATAVQLGYASSLEMSSIQARAAAVAAEQKSNADQVAAVDAQTHRIAEEQLALQAQAAAQTLLNAGAAGANAAAQLANSSSHIDVLTAAYYRLAAAQAAAAQAKTNAQALSDQRAGERDGGSGRTAAQIQFEADQDRKRRAAQVRRAEEAERAAKKAGGGRVAAAQATAAKLEAVETKAGDKIASIIQDAQEKITAIAEREAAKQQAALQKLNESIATSAADRRVSNEADDLDLIGVTDEKEAAKLNDRERAQAKAREAEKRAAEEARATALAGDAELAQRQYEIREKQIGDQQQLDEKYAEKQRELAEDPAALDAAKTQYDEATRANEERAKLGIDLAGTEAEQKKKAIDEEKAAVIQAANDQANDVIAAAERSATGVKTASADAKKIAVENLKAIGDAVNAIPSQKTITITVNQQGTVGASSAGGGGGGGGGGGPNKAAGGGTFVTTGKTTLTVGDNPGGRELVTVTPLSGTGQTTVSGNMIKLAGGGVIDAGDGYTTPVAGSPASGGGKKKKKGKGTPPPADAKAARQAIKESIELIKLQNELRKTQAEAARLRPAPINYAWIEGLAIEAQEITRIVTSKLLPLKKDEAEALGKYASANGQAVDVLKNIADLRTMQAEAKEERPGPIIMAYIEGLASEAQQITQIVRSHLIPETELENEMYSAYADAVSSSVSVLNDAADLREKLSKPTSPIDIRYINQLVADAAVVSVITRATLVPTTEEQAEALGLYADAVGNSVGILSDVLDLGKNLRENGVSPISNQMIIALADQGVRVATLVKGRLIPTTKEQGEALSAYADLVGASVSVLKDVSGLSGNLFADYTSPSDAQLALLATDAHRLSQAFFAAGTLMGKEGAEAGKAYAEGVGAAFSAAKDGLLVIDALKSGDFVLPQGALKQFETSSMDILATMQALGGMAATIPASDVAALQTVTAAISGQAEALIKLAAVPFGDLGGAAWGLGQSGGTLGSVGSTTITNTYYNTFQLPQGTPQQLATEAMRLLNQQMQSRR